MRQELVDIGIDPIMLYYEPEIEFQGKIEKRGHYSAIPKTDGWNRICKENQQFKVIISIYTNTDLSIRFKNNTSYFSFIWDREVAIRFIYDDASSDCALAALKAKSLKQLKQQLQKVIGVHCSSNHRDPKVAKAGDGFANRAAETINRECSAAKKTSKGCCSESICKTHQKTWVSECWIVLFELMV